jgi:hypothetical protein
MRTREFTLEGQVPGDNFWHVAGSQDGHWVAGDDFARELWLSGLPANLQLRWENTFLTL